MKTTLACVALLLLLMPACARKKQVPMTPKEVLSSLSATTASVVSTDPVKQQQAVRLEQSLALILGDTWDEKKGSDWSTLMLLDLPQGKLLAQEAKASPETIRLSLIDEGQGKHWSQKYNANRDWVFGRLVAETKTDAVTWIRLELQKGGLTPDVPCTLIIAVESKDCTLVRALDGKDRVANAKLLGTHPDLVLSEGSLTGDRVRQLAALLWLASPKGAEARKDSKIQTLIQGLASSTDAWIAEGAAVAAP